MLVRPTGTSIAKTYGGPMGYRRRAPAQTVRRRVNLSAGWYKHTCSHSGNCDLAGAVVMDRKQKLMACSALLGAWLVVPGAASAQMSDAYKIQALERQTQLLQKQLQEQSELMRRQSELMQQQLKEVKDELARARGKTEKVEASSQKVEAKAAAPSLPAAPPRQSAKSPIFKAPPPAEEKVKVTLGGFVTADTVWRQRNMVADMGTPFNAIPFPFSPLYDEHEFHGSARESRISLLIEGKIDPWQEVAGYFETDFLGVGGSTAAGVAASNYNETNAWPMRLRQAYVTYDN